MTEPIRSVIPDKFGFAPSENPNSKMLQAAIDKDGLRYLPDGVYVAFALGMLASYDLVRERLFERLEGVENWVARRVNMPADRVLPIGHP